MFGHDLILLCLADLNEENGLVRSPRSGNLIRIDGRNMGFRGRGVDSTRSSRTSQFGGFDTDPGRFELGYRRRKLLDLLRGGVGLGYGHGNKRGNRLSGKEGVRVVMVWY